METNGVTSYRHRNNNSPSSERFLGLFSQSQNPNSDTNFIDDELDENDVFWTGNFSQSDQQSISPTTNTDRNRNSNTFRRVDSSGIFAALRIDDQKGSFGDNRLLKRKISLPSSNSASSRFIPTVPKPQTSHDREYFLSLPSGNNFRHSAPMNVPMKSTKGKEVVESELSDDDSDKEMLPPHEIVARGSSQADMTFSVLEGVGRTLKGRDLRQVRNAVWRQTDVKVLVKCDKVKQFTTTTTEKDGSFEAELTTDPSSTYCQAQLLGASEQLCSYKRTLVSNIVKAPDSKSYTISTPLAFFTSCTSKTKLPLSPSDAKSTAGTSTLTFESSKTVDLPLPSEWGLPPTSYYIPIIPIGIP